MRVDLFGDGVGAVEYISHMGTDLSVVNAARVSFGAEKEKVARTIGSSAAGVGGRTCERRERKSVVGGTSQL